MTPPDTAEALLDLWRTPPEKRPDPVAAFGALYTDPVLVNGTPLTVLDLVQRARDVHQAFTELTLELVDRVQSDGKLAVAFHQRGRHVGPWRTSLGDVPATGRVVQGLGIDILTIDNGKISHIWVLADDLQRLIQVDAVQLSVTGPPPPR